VDSVFTGSSNPLLSRVESNLVNGGTSVKRSVFFSKVIEVPDLKGVFFTSGSNVVTQRRNGEGVNVFCVSFEGELDQEV